MSLTLQIRIIFVIILSITRVIAAEGFERVGSNEQAFFTYKPIYFGATFYHTDSNNSGESKYQFSFKYELFSESSWYLAYTQKTLWSTQADSAPIKETNYAPEFFYALEMDNEFLPLIQFGLLKHESNGEAEPGSKSWNIHYIEPIIKYEEYSFRLTLWVPFLFQSKDSATGGTPSIFEHYGKGELEVGYMHENGDKHTLLLREGSPDGVYALQYQWDVNLNGLFGEGGDQSGWNTQLFLQVFKGYGETLNTYNINTTRVIGGLSIVQ